MKLSNLNTIVNAAIVSSLVFAGSAQASSVSNSYSNEWTNGTRNIDVQNVRTETGNITNVNQGIKCETFGGDFNACNVSFDGDKLKGNGTSANFVPVDPTAIITTVKETTNSSFTDSTMMNFSEDSNFTGHTYTHTVSAE